MKTIDIKGKAYVMVHERIKAFREKYPDYGLISEIVELTEERVVMKATIQYGDGILAVGHAYEDKDSTFINKTSFIENCETSAWGRALANLGIGIDESIASADEVATAIQNQTKDERPWLEHKDYDSAMRAMNMKPEKAERKAIYDSLDTKYRMKKDWRRQLLEIVEQRDINV